jgi:hypothetical protein
MADPNGVRTIYPIVGSYRTDFNDPNPSDSIRWSLQRPPVNLEMTGYFKGSGSSSNTVDIKLHGGKHSRPDDRPGACCYIPTIPLQGGESYLRTECPHPDYRDCTPRRGASENNSLGDAEWRGYKGIIWNKSNGGVHIEVWEDQGNNDGSTPANQWVRLFKHDHDPGQTCGRFSTPLLGPTSGPDNHECTFRIDDDPNTQAKWLSAVEINPGITPPPPPPPPPPSGATKPKIITMSGNTYLNVAYENVSGKFLNIKNLPFGGPHAKIITESGKQYVYLYYYRAANLFTTLGRIPLQ